MEEVEADRELQVEADRVLPVQVELPEWMSG